VTLKWKSGAAQELPLDSEYGIRSEPGDRQTIRELAHVLDRAHRVEVSVDGAGHIALPPAVKEGLARVAAYLGASDFVAIQPMDQTLTTQEAADMLGVSRPYLISLLGNEEGQIPYFNLSPTGTHRRIMLADVLKFRADRAAAVRHEGEAELARGMERAAGEDSSSAQASREVNA